LVEHLEIQPSVTLPGRRGVLRSFATAIGPVRNGPLPRRIVDRTRIRADGAGSAVTPASFWTLTRNWRQPFSTSSSRTGPCATFTRDSGLIWMPTRHGRRAVAGSPDGARRVRVPKCGLGAAFLGAEVCQVIRGFESRRTCPTNGCRSGFGRAAGSGWSATGEEAGTKARENEPRHEASHGVHIFF
jgi:hypothetical protein